MDGLIFCQSCAMPMEETGIMYGSNFNGSKNPVYCQFCFASGSFTEDLTMQEMIEKCMPHMLEYHPEMSKEEAIGKMKQMFPKLKRW